MVSTRNNDGVSGRIASARTRRRSVDRVVKRPKVRAKNSKNNMPLELSAWKPLLDDATDDFHSRPGSADSTNRTPYTDHGHGGMNVGYTGTGLYAIAGSSLPRQRLTRRGGARSGGDDRKDGASHNIGAFSSSGPARINAGGRLGGGGKIGSASNRRQQSESAWTRRANCGVGHGRGVAVPVPDFSDDPPLPQPSAAPLPFPPKPGLQKPSTMSYAAVAGTRKSPSRVPMKRPLGESSSDDENDNEIQESPTRRAWRTDNSFAVAEWGDADINDSRSVGTSKEQLQKLAHVGSETQQATDAAPGTGYTSPPATPKLPTEFGQPLAAADFQDNRRFAENSSADTVLVGTAKNLGWIDTMVRPVLAMPLIEQVSRPASGPVKQRPPMFVSEEQGPFLVPSPVSYKSQTPEQPPLELFRVPGVQSQHAYTHILPRKLLVRPTGARPQPISFHTILDPSIYSIWFSDQPKGVTGMPPGALVPWPRCAPQQGHYAAKFPLPLGAQTSVAIPQYHWHSNVFVNEDYARRAVEVLPENTFPRFQDLLEHIDNLD